jgi:alanine dehydrogenase
VPLLSSSRMQRHDSSFATKVTLIIRTKSNAPNLVLHVESVLGTVGVCSSVHTCNPNPYLQRHGWMLRKSRSSDKS